MKAFVSYSVTDNNEFILTLLSSELRKKDFIITTSQNFRSNILSYNTLSEIETSHLFIGIITGNGNEKKWVLNEWQYAVKRNIPNLLLIEDTVRINQNFTGNYILFNRRNPQKAINAINRRMTPARSATSTKAEDIIPWVLGGAALLAIISLLTNNDK